MGDTCLEVATFHDLLFPPEKTGYLRVKFLIAKEILPKPNVF
jgi:hypothetical protein